MASRYAPACRYIYGKAERYTNTGDTMNGTDILVTAIEGGTGYWAEVIEYRPEGSTRYAVIRDMEDGTEYRLTPSKLTEAAQAVLRKYPNTAGARYIREDDIDAEAADMIAQVACFGEIVYG